MSCEARPLPKAAVRKAQICAAHGERAGDAGGCYHESGGAALKALQVQQSLSLPFSPWESLGTAASWILLFATLL